MTKTERIKAIAEKAGITNSQAEQAMDAFLAGIIDELKTEKNCMLYQFGTFSIEHREARTGRNLQTGETIQIPAKDVVKFKPAKALSEQF